MDNPKKEVSEDNQDLRDKYVLLMDCIFREYERESGRKARLDSKIAGYFTLH